jgi:AraC-like DNA-binding protein/mannose-6-phosphate isomerase-like protein (cupin superfamily)
MNIYELKEKSQHGRDDFPLQVYHPTGLMASYHWHDECEFIYVRSGHAIIRKSSEYLEVYAGQCVYIKPNELHAIHSEDMKSFDFYAIVFKPDLLFSSHNVTSQFISPKYRIHSHIIPNDSGSYIIELIIKTCQAYENGSFSYELQITSYLCSIFATIFTNHLYVTEDIYKDEKSHQKFESVIKYIHLNFLEPISIETLAQLAGYSISHFTRFFKTMTGNSPIDYINRQRIYYACKKLKETDQKILDIALESGFNHVGHFIKTFSKYMGSTPHNYRYN